MKLEILEFNLRDKNRARWRRFAAEWHRDPDCRPAIEELCAANPHWGVRPCAGGLLYSPTKTDTRSPKN